MNRSAAVQTLQTAYFLAFLFARRLIACQVRTTIWTKPRSPWFLTDIAGNLSDREWEQNFRVSRGTFTFYAGNLSVFSKGSMLLSKLSKPSRITI